MALGTRNEVGDHLHTKEMTINMGPSHPAMHGTVKMVLSLSGETVQDLDIHVGYLHRGFEKECETGTWNQAIPYTDRLNYCSPLINNVGYVLAVEKLAGIEITERCKWIRTLVCELSRITDHLTCLGAQAMELAAFTPYLYLIQARELIYQLVEELTGARLTVSYTRVGGLRYDLTDTFEDHYRDRLPRIRVLLSDAERMLTKNRVFYDRMAGTGVVTKENAIDYGFTGPVLRSTGVPYDVRKDHPYLAYPDLDFVVPVGTNGDNFDRYLIRLEELRQSMSMMDQCFANMPDGPINIDDWNVVLPPKEKVYNTIEAMIAHFKVIMHGSQIPKGEAYGYVEGGNGELGFYVVSEGERGPYKLHVRAPCFYVMGGIHPMLVGGMLADIVPTFDSINMIGGEIDR
jgi:NADH-quinone oxidoreductase subunit D